MVNYPSRKRPAKGLLLDASPWILVYLTVCTKGREPWLASAEVHQTLRQVWAESRAWLVGRYMLLPDHLHLFASPGEEPVLLGNWVRYWKSRFSKQAGNPDWHWQAGHWDRRIRSWEGYTEKWQYVVSNPVRHGLVERAEDWPYQGEIHPLV